MERRRSSSTATAARAATGVCRVPGHKIPAEMMTPASTRTAPHHAAPGHWRLISASRPHGDPTSRRPRCSTRHLGINSNLCCQSERDRVPARQAVTGCCFGPARGERGRGCNFSGRKGGRDGAVRRHGEQAVERRRRVGRTVR
ncbi:hypothetical protein PAHAL_5G228300 [Panicum hallii]|uniref:Uncharacterized protein n=1 Tax=Panicum hallii TaxID=206008 RepID=A0A2T8IKW6_9POAL|nr:hypothetical protein PAHAL_5G228300 [Panicum hallii]